MNLPFLLTAVLALGAGTLHVYTFEVWIWPKLGVECFPPTPFGDASVTRGFYRVVWHFFTVSWLLTLILFGAFAFGSFFPSSGLIVLGLIIYWSLIILVIFVVGALNLEPGQSYIRTMLRAFQWVLVAVMVACMVWGWRQLPQ